MAPLQNIRIPGFDFSRAFEWSRSWMRFGMLLSNLPDTRPRNRIRKRDRNESPPTRAVVESRVTRARKDRTRAVPLSDATGRRRLWRRRGVERFSRLRSFGRVSAHGGANRGTHSSHPHPQGAVGIYVNCRMRVRLRRQEDLWAQVPWSRRQRRTTRDVRFFGLATISSVRSLTC